VTKNDNNNEKQLQTLQQKAMLLSGQSFPLNLGETVFDARFDYENIRQLGTR